MGTVLGFWNVGNRGAGTEASTGHRRFLAVFRGLLFTLSASQGLTCIFKKPRGKWW